LWSPLVGIRKKQTAITADNVPVVFNDARITQLVAIGRLPDSGDRQLFGESVRKAARIYTRDARSPSVGTVREEIAALYRAAERRQYERATMLLTQLSPQARTYLAGRLKLPGPRAAKLKLPSVQALRNISRRDAGCEMIERVCRIGGRYIEGRKRPSGKRSTTRQPLLFAPVPNKHPRKRGPELRFVMYLQSAWLEAVGKPPTATVNPSRSDRPFADFVRECLKLVGAKHADAVGLINELHRRKSHVRKCLADLRRRKRREAQEAKKAF
jgi:hypothetical protein